LPLTGGARAPEGRKEGRKERGEEEREYLHCIVDSNFPVQIDDGFGCLRKSGVDP